MPRGLKSPVPQPTPEERAFLAELVRRRQTPRGLATQAQIILLSADHPELTLAEISEKVGLYDDTVGIWRRRYGQHSVDELSDAPRCDAPGSIHDQEIEQVVRFTVDTLPTDARH